MGLSVKSIYLLAVSTFLSPDISSGAEGFILQDQHCLTLANPEGSKEVSTRKVPNSEALCEKEAKGYKCKFRSSESTTDTFGSLGTIIFNTETENKSSLVIYSSAENIRYRIDLKLKDFRYSEMYTVPSAPFLLVKSCYGSLKAHPQ